MKQRISRIIVYMLIFFILFGICQILLTSSNEEMEVRINMICPSNDEYIIYYINNEDEFFEEQSVTQAIINSSNLQEITFPIKNDYSKIRIDFGMKANQMIKVQEICCLKPGEQIVYSNADLKRKIEEHSLWMNDMEIRYDDMGKLYFVTTGIDPFLQFRNLEFQKYEVQKPLFVPLLLAAIMTVFIFRFVYLKEIAVFFTDVITNRGLIYALAKNDFKSKYNGSYFGIIWAFVHPLCTIMLFWFVFEVGFRSAPVSDIPFALWLACGLVPWFFFSEAWNGATYAFIEYSYLVKKVVFKISILPLVKILSAFFVHIFFIVFLILFFCCYHIYPTIHVLQIIYYSFCLIALVVGISFISASIIIFFKDLGQVITIFLQFGMWLTPIMWAVNIMPSKILPIIKINPMFYIVDGYRNAMIYGNPLFYDIKLTVYFWFVTIGFFVVGIVLFRKLRPHFADVL